MVKRQHVLGLTGILIFASLLGLGVLTNGHDWGDDFASYIMQARSIVDGDIPGFVKHNAFTIQNSDFPIGPVAYPWGYPLLLAPIYKCSGLNLYGFKMENILFFLLFLVCFYFLLARNQLTSSESLLLVSIFAFNPELIAFHDNILSDIPFLFFSTFAILLIDKFVIDRDGESTINEGVMIGIAVFGAYFVRSNGLFLLIALLIWQMVWLLKKKRGHSVIKSLVPKMTVPYITFAFLWVASSFVFPGGEGWYLTQYGLFSVDGLQSHLLYYLQIGAAFFSSIPAGNVVYAILVIFFLIGFASSPVRDLFMKLYLVLTLLMFILYPLLGGLRFLFPVLPIFIYLIHRGIKTTLSVVGRRYPLEGRWLVNALWISILVISFCISSDMAINNLSHHRQRSGPFDPDSVELFAFIKDHTPANSVIIFFKPRALRMMTGRDSIMIDECAGLNLGNYVVVELSGEASEQLSLRELSHCGIERELVFESVKFIVYKNSTIPKT